MDPPAPPSASTPRSHPEQHRLACAADRTGNARQSVLVTSAKLEDCRARQVPHTPALWALSPTQARQLPAVLLRAADPIEADTR
jgi:hypothetical protein